MFGSNRNDKLLSRNIFSDPKTSAVDRVENSALSLLEKITLITVLSVVGVFLGINAGVFGLTIFLIFAE